MLLVQLYALITFLPFALRRAMVFLPSRVDIRFRNPSLFFRFRLCG